MWVMLATNTAFFDRRTLLQAVGDYTLDGKLATSQHFTTYSVPEKNSATPQLVPYVTNIIVTFCFKKADDLEIAQSLSNTFVQTRSWCKVHVGNSRTLQHSHQQRMKTIERDPFQSKDIVAECLHQKSLVLMWRETRANCGWRPTLDSDEVVRRLTLAQSLELHVHCVSQGQ